MLIYKKYYLILSQKSHSHSLLFSSKSFYITVLPHNSQQKKLLALSKILKIDDTVNPLSINLTSFQGSNTLSHPTLNLFPSSHSKLLTLISPASIKDTMRTSAPSTETQNPPEFHLSTHQSLSGGFCPISSFFPTSHCHQAFSVQVRTTLIAF